MLIACWSAAAIGLGLAVASLVWALRETTRRAQAAAELQASKRRHQQLLAETVHDLRNILSPLDAAGQLLARDPQNVPQVRELAELISRQLEQLKRLIDERLQAARTGSVAPPPPAGDSDAELPTYRLLVVDDDASAAHLLSRVLGKLGQQVQVAGSAEEALTLLPAFAADAVISDIGMPGVSGYELAARIRALALPQQPVLIALTGYGRESDRREALAAGFDQHLTKPIGIPELTAVIESLRSR